MDLTLYTKKIGKEYTDQERIIIHKDLNDIIDIVGYLLNTLVENNIQVQPNRYYIETIINKFCMHFLSTVRLMPGATIYSKLNDHKYHYFDIASIYILSRAIIENYLTFNYLYITPKDFNEEIFRFNIYELAGLISQNQFDVITDESKIVKESNTNRITELQIEIFNNPLLSTVKNEIKNSIKKGKSVPRLFSWWELINMSKLNNQILHQGWSLFSNYAHTEFISQMQIQGYIVDTDHTKSSIDMVAESLLMVCSVFIKEFSGIFPEVNDRFNTLNKKDIEVIDFFYDVGISD